MINMIILWILNIEKKTRNYKNNGHVLFCFLATTSVCYNSQSNSLMVLILAAVKNTKSFNCPFWNAGKSWMGWSTRRRWQGRQWLFFRWVMRCLFCLVFIERAMMQKHRSTNTVTSGIYTVTSKLVLIKRLKIVNRTPMHFLFSGTHNFYHFSASQHVVTMVYFHCANLFLQTKLFSSEHRNYPWVHYQSIS